MDEESCRNAALGRAKADDSIVLCIIVPKKQNCLKLLSGRGVERV